MIIKAVPRVFAIWTYVSLVGFSIAGHLISIFLRRDPGIVAPLAGLLTLAGGVFVSLVDVWSVGNKRTVLASAIVLIAGFSVELLGLATGFPFGKYHYTDRWWPVVQLGGIGNFPLLLPFAWLMVTASAAFACQIWKSRFANALAAAFTATALDLLMEGTLSGKMGYWVWAMPGPLPGGSPLQNSASWFILSFLAALVFYQTKVKVLRAGSITVLIGQAALMTALWF